VLEALRLATLQVCSLGGKMVPSGPLDGLAAQRGSRLRIRTPCRDASNLTRARRCRPSSLQRSQSRPRTIRASRATELANPLFDLECTRIDDSGARAWTETYGARKKRRGRATSFAVTLARTCARDCSALCASKGTFTHRKMLPFGGRTSLRIRIFRSKTKSLVTYIPPSGDSFPSQLAFEPSHSLAIRFFSGVVV
jgi:hypothetical protein